MMKQKIALTMAASVLGMTAAVAQAQTTYSSQAAFAAAATGLSTETFAGCGSSTTGFSGSLSSTSGPCSGILPGVTYSQTSGGGLYIAAPGQSANATTALGVNTPAGGAMTISFAQNQSEFGADLFQNTGGGQQSGFPTGFSLNFLLGGSNVGSFTTLVASGTGGFFGLTGLTFNAVTIAQTNGYAVVDNVSFGNGAAAAVPETATWAMMILGMGAVGFAMRRRNSVNVVTKLA